MRAWQQGRTDDLFTRSWAVRREQQQSRKNVCGNASATIIAINDARRKKLISDNRISDQRHEPCREIIPIVSQI